MLYTIRVAKPEDYESLISLWQAAGLSVRLQGRDRREAFLHQLAQVPALYLVAVERDRMIGVVLGSHDHRKGWINRVAVLPEYRRHGIAAALVRACEEAIRAEGIGIIATLVEVENTSSAKLFEELGYLEDVPVRYFRKLRHPDA